jgi:hypothetical protein
MRSSYLDLWKAWQEPSTLTNLTLLKEFGSILLAGEANIKVNYFLENILMSSKQLIQV